MAITATRYTPYVEVEFHTADALYSVSKGGWNSLQPTQDLLDVQTMKDMQNAVGTWQLTLTATRGNDGMDWYDRLSLNDMVVIKMGRPPEVLATVMVGLIDEVRRSKSIGASDAQRRITVRGSDFGKVLSKAMLRFYPALAADPTISDNAFYKTSAGWVAMLSVFIGSDLFQGKPADMVSLAVTKILFRLMSINFTYWNTSTGSQLIHLANVLRYRLDDSPNIMPFALTMQNYEGAIWNMLQRVSASPFNELFLDTRGYMPEELQAGTTPEYMRVNSNVVKDSNYGPDDISYMKQYGIAQNPNFSATFGDDKAKVVLFLRNTPFDYTNWNNLYTHTVDYSEILSEDIGFSDQENYNVFFATNSLSVPTATDLTLLMEPVVDQANVERFGMNPMEVQIEGINLEADMLSSSIMSAQTMSQKLYDWYHLNKDYKAGTVTVMGRGFYKIGQRLLIKKCEYNKFTKKWDDLMFYIEGVSQSFTVMDAWNTTLTLTRGQRPDTLKPSAPTAPQATITTKTISSQEVS